MKSSKSQGKVVIPSEHSKSREVRMSDWFSRIFCVQILRLRGMKFRFAQDDRRAAA